MSVPHPKDNPFIFSVDKISHHEPQEYSDIETLFRRLANLRDPDWRSEKISISQLRYATQNKNQMFDLEEVEDLKNILTLAEIHKKHALKLDIINDTENENLLDQLKHEFDLMTRKEPSILSDDDLVDWEAFLRLFELKKSWEDLQKQKLGYFHIGTSLETAFKTLLAGGIAGSISRTVVAPFERIKILFQTQGNPPRYTSVIQATLLIFKEEGFRGLMRGNFTNCIRIFPTSAIQFFAYETYKKKTERAMYWVQNYHSFLSTADQSKVDLNPYQRTITGGLAGTTALILTYPLDFVRARLTVQTSTTYRGITHCLAHSIANNGFFSVYRGLWPSIVGVIPYVGIDFAAFETIKDHLPKDPITNQVNAKWTLFAGAAAGTLGQTVAYPLDLVRRRLQLQGFSQQAGIGTVEKYDGMTDAFRKIYQSDGVKGFYRGLVPNCKRISFIF